MLAFPQTPAHSGTRLLQHSVLLHTHPRIVHDRPTENSVDAAVRRSAVVFN